MNTILQAISKYLIKHGIKIRTHDTPQRITIHHPHSIYIIVIGHIQGLDHIAYNTTPNHINIHLDIADPELLPTILKTTQKILKGNPLK
jgi:hypothetical protein